MSLFYLDASALTKLVIAERGSDELRAGLAGHRLFTSRIAVVEVTRAVGRVMASADLSPVFDRVAFVELDASLAERAATLGGPPLRALDAIHLASAELLGGELTAFITYDARQAAAARASGIEVRSPGVEPAGHRS